MPGSPGVAARARVQCDFPAFIIQREPAQPLVRTRAGPPICGHCRNTLLLWTEVLVHQLIPDFEAQHPALDHRVVIMETGIDPRVLNFMD